MSVNDPISDLLTRIRNGQKQRYKYVDVIHNKQLREIARVMQEQGFVENVLVNDEGRKMRIFLRYVSGRTPMMQGLKRVSSPGLRRYIKYQKIPKICGGLGIAILSTSKGIVDGMSAEKMKVGGEFLCYIW